MSNLKLNPSNLKKYSLFLALLAAVLLAAGIYFLWLPRYQNFKQNLQMLSSKEEEIDLKKEYNRELEGNLNLLTEYENELFKIKTALPEKFSISSLVSFIQNKNSESGLSLSEISFSEDAASAVSESSAKGGEMAPPSGFVVKNVNFNIAVSGSYSAFKKFLSSVWKNSRMVNIGSVAFTSPFSEEGAGNIFDFNLGITASYYAKAEESAETK